MPFPGSSTSDYAFDLPLDRIAQAPVEPRDASRLMIVDRSTGSIAHAHFRDLATLIPANDVLVLNTTRVIRARLLGTRPSGAPAEILLLKPLGNGQWEAMVSPGAKLRPKHTMHIAPGFEAEIVATTDRRTRVVQLRADVPLDEAIERHGHVPLPPYIQRHDRIEDSDRYQTVYAEQSGSVAAPTAGLHFTPALLASLAAKGVRRANLLLHVGAGTFKPVETDDPAEHGMHEEWYVIPEGTATLVNDAHAHGAKLWAVGTTAARALETTVGEDGLVVPREGETRIFIRPPYAFRAVDHLITNFHLPRSTLLMLVAAMAGYDLIMRAYREAITTGYQFYSYGDAMVIL